MDRHMDNKHPDRLNLPRETGDNGVGDVDADGEPSSGRRCLGDLCPVLGCGQFDTGSCRVEIAGGDASGNGGGRVRRGCGMCDPSVMERRRDQCLALFDRCGSWVWMRPRLYRVFSRFVVRAPCFRVILAAPAKFLRLLPLPTMHLSGPSRPEKAARGAVGEGLVPMSVLQLFLRLWTKKWKFIPFFFCIASLSRLLAKGFLP